MITPVILAGGYGERLWPLSTHAMPKPFALRDVCGHSLFQATVLRIRGLELFSAPLVVCNQLHHLLVIDQLRAVGVDNATLILEPEARNTAPAIALAALHCAQLSPEDIMLVMPADHQIDDSESLLSALEHAKFAAQMEKIVTFSVTPTSAETGYGYIQRGKSLNKNNTVYSIECFIEKPEREVAERLIQSGEYGWNSGIFMMRPDVVVEEYRRHSPEIFSACEDAHAARKIESESIIPDAQAFANARAIAFDRAIMERTTRGAVMPLDMSWRDLGSFGALDEVAAKDAQGNAVTGNVTLMDVTGSHIYTDGPLISAIGLKDMLVIAANGHMLVTPKNCANQLRNIDNEQTLLSPITQRPWGHFQVIEAGQFYQVKQLTVRTGGKISLQRHAKRSEHWVVVRGIAMVTRGQEQFMLYENQSTFIPAGEVHRLENAADTPLIIIEVQTGSYLGEDDIERFEDIYARV